MSFLILLNASLNRAALLSFRYPSYMSCATCKFLVIHVSAAVDRFFFIMQRRSLHFLKPNIMLVHNVIYVDTICLCGLHGWFFDSHQSNLSFESQSFLSP